MLTSTSKEDQAKRGIRPNPDGDIDLPGAPYQTFRYPPCPTCLSSTPNGYEPLKVDQDGAWVPSASKVEGEPARIAGILKPAVVMFGEAIPQEVRIATENVVGNAERLLVLGSSLATYSAWKLVRTVREDRHRPLGLVNLGGVRGEEALFGGMPADEDGTEGLRISLDAGEILNGVLQVLK
jgi:NAD+-dependent protein deacetylase sirtuin 4